MMRQSKTAFILFICSFIFSMYLIVVLRNGSELAFDTWSQKMIIQLFGKETQTFFEVISQLGTKQGIGLVALLFIGWIWWRRRDYIGIAVVILAVGLGNVVNKCIKSMVGRDRPVTAPAEDMMSLSFPSGHAMVGIILYFLVAYFFIKHYKNWTIRRVIVTVAGILVLLIGVSRNVLLAHFPTDVMGGFVLGYVWVYGWLIVYEWIVNKRKTT